MRPKLLRNLISPDLPPRFADLFTVCRSMVMTVYYQASVALRIIEAGQDAKY